MVLTDIHCHILPGVDDGAQSAKETAALLRRQYKDGVRRIILTPHYRAGMFEPPMDKINYRFRKLREKAMGIGQYGIHLYLGCEYHRSSEMCRDLEDGKRPTMAGSSYVLTEFSSVDQYDYIRNTIYDLVAHGYIPIIAHVERYDVLFNDPELIRDLIGLGARIQVNASSVLGEQGHKIKKYCKKLMDKDYVHYIASDCHDTKVRVPNLGKCASYVEKKWGTEYAKRIFQTNPNQILGR